MPTLRDIFEPFAGERRHIEVKTVFWVTVVNLTVTLVLDDNRVVVRVEPTGAFKILAKAIPGLSAEAYTARLVRDARNNVWAEAHEEGDWSTASYSIEEEDANHWRLEDSFVNSITVNFARNEITTSLKGLAVRMRA